MSKKTKIKIQYMDMDGSFHSDKAPSGVSVKYVCVPASSGFSKPIENLIANVLCISPNGKKDQAPAWFRQNKLKEAKSILAAFLKVAKEESHEV